MENILKQQSYVTNVNARNLRTARTQMIGAFKAIKDMHLDIPGDISLIGFEDFSLADYLSPGITLLQHPAYEMGEISAKTLFERLEHTCGGAAFFWINKGI